MRKFILSVLCFISVGSLVVRDGDAANVSLGWDSNPEPNVAGYKIYYVAPDSDPVSLDVGLATSGVVLDLIPGTTYQFYVTAYNTSGLESTPSPTIFYTVPDELIDSDGDGMPDSYEIANGLNPYSNDRAADVDRDGLTNVQEYFAGTNPSNSESVLEIASVVYRAPAFAMRFQSIVAKSYTIEANESFPTGAWTIISNITGTGEILEVVDPEPKGNARIYRVKAD